MTACKIEFDVSCRRVLAYLKEMNAAFSPTLSSMVNIDEYASKIAQHAVVCFAVKDGQDAGMVAFYLNGAEKFSFVTSISTSPSIRGKGAGHLLMRQVKTVSREKGCRTVILKVHVHNAHAIRFYTSEGFAVQRTDGDFIVMARDLVLGSEDGA